MTSIPGTHLVSAASLDRSTETLASRFSPIDERPALGRHLVIRRVVQAGEVKWVVKNTETNLYYTFDDPEWAVIELFDGTRTRDEIVDEYNRRVPGAGIDLKFILEYEEMLLKVDLIDFSGTRRQLALVGKFKNARKRAAEAKAEGFNIFFLLFKVVDPDRFLSRTAKYVRWIWRPTTVAISTIFFLMTIGVFLQHWGPIWDGTIELYSFLKKPFWDAVQFFLLLTIIGAIHELGHGYAVKIYGGEVHDMGIALLYFTPAFYCDTTDALLFDNKWHRLWVTIAGIYVEAFLCTAATFLWVASYPDTFLHEFAYKTMLFTGISTIFFNINPLIKIDGYHALTAVLEIPELREESFSYLGAVFQRHILRLRVDVPVVTRRKRRIYLVYGTLAVLYIGSIMAFIGGLFYNFYSRYFPNFALILLLLTLYRLFRKRVRLLVRVSRLFYLDKKELLMSRRARPLFWITGALLVLLLAIPWPRRTIVTETALRPAIAMDLQSSAAGFISSVDVREGSAVRKGDRVAVLVSRKLQSELVRLEAANRRVRENANVARGAGDPAKLFSLDQQRRAFESEIERLRNDNQRLVLRSPIDGTVMTPRVEDLPGRFVGPGTLIVTVADCRTMIADIEISERLLSHVHRGDRVVMQPRGLPLRSIEGRVASISTATATTPGTSLGTEASLLPASRPDRFTVRAVFDNSLRQLKPGMTGRVKIRGEHASYLRQTGSVLWRWLRTIVW